MADMRIGSGFDVHPLVEGRPLVLGGVHVPYSKGLQGQSDGDALCHAVKTAKEFESVRETPIIFVSAVKDIAGSRFGFHEGAEGLSAPDDYLDKPVKPADLLARIERLLGK